MAARVGLHCAPLRRGWAARGCHGSTCQPGQSQSACAHMVIRVLLWPPLRTRAMHVLTGVHMHVGMRSCDVLWVHFLTNANQQERHRLRLACHERCEAKYMNKTRKWLTHDVRTLDAAPSEHCSLRARKRVMRCMTPRCGACTRLCLSQRRHKHDTRHTAHA
jgi:hypothetical protein